MSRDPNAWKRLGTAIRADRERQGLTRDELAARVIARGGAITIRSIGSLERGTVPKVRDKPPTLAPTLAALGWPLGADDRILAGESPAAVLSQSSPEEPKTAGPTRESVFGLLPRVYEFSRGAVALGGNATLRDEFDALAQSLVESIPVGAGRSAYGLAAYRPHAPGEGVPDDDAARIERALGREV
jgi:transcriptional regulator with XRE-family HTH domain